MKQNRFGQASVLSPQHLDNLIDALPAGPHRVLATILRYTAARVSEARLLTWAAISDTHILFAAATTKTKTSREVPLAPQLLDVLKRWKAETNPRPTDFIVPGGVAGRPMSRQAFDKQLRATCEQLGLSGVSTHSFRRTCLTTANDKGISLRHLQAISGHRSLMSLSVYLDVNEAAKQNVISAFG